MTDTVTAPTAPPKLLVTLTHDFAQKALTTACTAAATAMGSGIITHDQVVQFAGVGASLAVYALGCFWTYAAAEFRNKRLAAAIAAPAVPAVK